ncbi:MAG: hypothetical protein WAL63_13295 [Solirubrobacteraceae bacterium]
MSLSEQARTGLREMPSNAAWLLSRVLKPAEAVGTAAESATAGARDQGRKVKAAVVDAAPFGGDSIDIRMRRAQDAGERARDAEERAAEAAHESKERSEHARDVSEHGRARMREVDRDTSRQVKQRIAEAQKAAEALVERERRAAETEATDHRQQVQAEVDDEVQGAQADAEASRQRAEELIEDATEKLAEARRLADEAAEAARTAAEEASRRASALASEAQRHADAAQAQVKETERLREKTSATAKRTARELKAHSDNGGLESYTKAELVALASGIGIGSATNKTKSELVDAIAKASRTGQ